jgi:pimeloyl-ACP methyl ester carboxylesterase
MKHILIIFALAGFLSCTKNNNDRGTTMSDSLNFKSGYSTVNGLTMYYEIYGQGKPLVLIHGAGSTIQTSFGRIIPHLAKRRQVIGVELQAHGHTNDRANDLSFQQDADDVALLLQNLKVTKADVFGFSNGGNTTMQLAIRHPNLVDKIIVGSAFYKRSGVYPQFWDFMNQATLADMPQQYKDTYIQVAPTPANLQSMHDKCVKRMLEFKDWSDDLLKSIQAQTLLIIGDADLVSPEHAAEMYRLIPHCQLAIIPGGHGKYMGENTTLKDNPDSLFIVPMIEEFLNGK